MEIIGGLLLVVGFVIAIVSSIWMLVKAFQVSILWGLGYIFIPFVSLIFLFCHWDEAKRPFLYGLVATVFIILGAVVMPGEIGAR